MRQTQHALPRVPETTRGHGCLASMFRDLGLIALTVGWTAVSVSGARRPRLLAQGSSNRVIASHLGIADKYRPGIISRRSSSSSRSTAARRRHSSPQTSAGDRGYTVRR
jgi:hypothetical protein